jgi:monoamine oxidase
LATDVAVEHHMADYDVVIIGAGAAGLAAATALTRHGFSIALVEARNRVGGRVYTVRPEGATLPIELGADFVHGRPSEIFGVAAEAGLRLYEHTGNTWAAREGRPEPEGNADDTDGQGEDGNVAAIFAAIQNWRGEDLSLQSLLDERFADTRWAGARGEIRRYAEGFDAAELDRVSVAWLQQTELASDAIDGERQFRVLDGYDRVLTWLRDNLPASLAEIRLLSVARELRWQRSRVSLGITAPDGEPLGDINARTALITVPLSVLQRSFDKPDSPGALRLSPEPPGKREALRLMAMGHAMKVVLQFSEVFWDPLPDRRANGHHLMTLPGVSFFFSDDQVMPTWWTSHPVAAPILTGWTGGPRAAALVDAPDESILDEAVAALARVLGRKRRDLEKLLVARYVHNWGADPYARGGYSYVCAGGMSAPAALAEPVDDTLFFAGEATSTTGHTGMVHGALQTGYQAADAIMTALAKSG